MGPSVSFCFRVVLFIPFIMVPCVVPGECPHAYALSSPPPLLTRQVQSFLLCLLLVQVLGRGGRLRCKLLAKGMHSLGLRVPVGPVCVAATSHQGGVSSIRGSIDAVFCG